MASDKLRKSVTGTFLSKVNPNKIDYSAAYLAS